MLRGLDSHVDSIFHSQSTIILGPDPFRPVKRECLPMSAIIVTTTTPATTDAPALRHASPADDLALEAAAPALSDASALETAKGAADATATPAPSKLRRPLPRLPVISFSLTIAAAGVALLLDILPVRAATLTPEIDTAVVLLFVPLCVLVLGILGEAARLSLRLRAVPAAPPRRAPLSDWTPGRGEG
jgi:hypothetical protein